ncbi:unnamed protein product [Symbiodinium sp. CCMP2592]|nr:unnamed protein product [Symbiodinium sp. CCMP2592]
MQGPADKQICQLNKVLVIDFCDLYTVAGLLTVNKAWASAVVAVYNLRLSRSTAGADWSEGRCSCKLAQLRRLLQNHKPTPLAFLWRREISPAEVEVDHVKGLSPAVMTTRKMRQFIRPVEKSALIAAAKQVIGGMRVIRQGDGLLDIDSASIPSMMMEGSMGAPFGYTAAWGRESDGEGSDGEVLLYDEAAALLPRALSFLDSGNQNHLITAQIDLSGKVPFQNHVSDLFYSMTGDADLEDVQTPRDMCYLAISGRVPRGRFPLYWRLLVCTHPCFYDFEQLSAQPINPSSESAHLARMQNPVWVLN